MQSLKPLLLVLLTYSLLSCAPTNPAPTRMGDEKISVCGEIPIGVTIDKRELDIAGATMVDFSLGKLEVKDTPQFQKIISETASNSAATDVLVCKTIARAGVRGNPEMVDYFTRMTHFFAGHPSTSEQLQWRRTNPFPKAAPQEQSTPVESPSMRLAKTCKQPVVGLRRQPEAFVPIWVGLLIGLKGEKFPPDRDLQSLYNLKGRYRDYYNTPDDFFSESLYTLKCLEDVGEIKLEKLGTTGTYGGKVFENQRIDFGEPSISNSNEWRRLTDSEKAQLSLILSNGSRYQIEIFRISTPDSIRLATDFYNLFTQLGWTVPHKPQTPEYEPEPGIRVMSIGDNIPSAPIKNMKERSGALLLTEALEKIKLPVMYEARGGMIADLTIHLEIGMKPEKH